MKIETRITEKFKTDKKITTLPFPKKNLLIEITNCCNNKCIFCYNKYMSRKKCFINENTCRKALIEAYNLGSREVGFYVTGEPLLNPHLSEYIKTAKSIGYEYIYITTNGILATLNKVIELHKSGLNSIKFSINAYNQNDYKLVNGTDNYNVVVKNLKDIYNWKKNNNINLKIFTSFITTKFTNNEELIKNTFSNWCDNIIIQPAINQGGLLPNTINQISDPIRKNNFSFPCSYPFDSVIITVEGYVTACCMDFENLLAYGNLNNKSLIEIWNNLTIKKLRKQHLEKNVRNTVCDNCINNSKCTPKAINNKFCNNKNILIK